MEKSLIEQNFHEVKKFLMGYFNQDIENEETALKEFFENPSWYISQIYMKLIEFINDKNFSDTVKADFIIKSLHSFTPTEPLEWLKDVSRQLEEYLKKHEG